MLNTIVVGGGIMGMMCARALSQKGHSVLLLEQDEELGKEASWAGGGICMPIDPWAYPPKAMNLIKRGIALYPTLAQELLAETGIDIEWRQTGLLLYDSNIYKVALQWAERYQFPLQLLTPQEIRLLAPVLAEQHKMAFWLPTVHQFRNSRLMQALKISLKQSSQVKSITHCKVNNFIQSGKNITGVETNQGTFSADKIIITAGAWTGDLIQKLDQSLPIVPMRGQILLWQAPAHLLPCIVLDREYYLIPREDGYILVGGTVEDVGFVNETTESAYNDIYNAAVALVPQLKEYPVVKHWSGLRPGSPDGIPFIEQVENFDNVWVNAGHYRNGLVMAPAATETLMNLMLG